MNGASLTEIAAVLGHKTLSMVKRYSHISDNHTSDVVTRMNNKIFNQEVVNA
jgi:site-specific recombinase XerD